MPGIRRRRWAPRAAALCLVLLWAGPARAYTEMVVATSMTEKAGRVMLNLRFGPPIDLVNSANMFAVGIDLGGAITLNRNGYVLLQPEVQFGSDLTAVLVPAGFQYDIPLPLRGLYIYPRISMGYAAFISSYTDRAGPITVTSRGTTHLGVAIPELGIKYVARGRFNFAFEPFSLPVFFNGETYAIQWRLMFSVGLNI